MDETKLTILKECLERAIKSVEANEPLTPEEQEWHNIFTELEDFGNYLAKNAPHLLMQPEYLISLIY